MAEILLLSALFMTALPIMILTDTYGETMYPGWTQEGHANVIPIQVKALAWQDHVTTALYPFDPITATAQTPALGALLPGPMTPESFDDLLLPVTAQAPKRIRPSWIGAGFLGTLTYVAGFVIGSL